MRRFPSESSYLSWLYALGLIVLPAVGCSAYDGDLIKIRRPGQPANDGGALPSDGGANDSGVIGRGDGGQDSDCQGTDPSCTRPHSLTTCVRGQCVLVECEAPYVDCDNDTDTGCEAQLDSLDHCGLCNAKCSLPGSETRCSGGRCEFVRCSAAAGDCDDDTANGCETPLDSINHCGGCGVVCPALPRSAPGCSGGKCGVGECLGAYGDCDGEADNGCEEPLASNTHCAGCDAPCAPAAAEGNCDSGQCAIIGCTSGAYDCDGLVANGCEATLDSAQNCGRCGAVCDLPLHATQAACVPGAQPSSRACAVDHQCASGAAGCVDGAPETGCEAGYADCDGLGANGCETALGTLSDCGGCGDACDEAGAITACTGGSCLRTGCAPGFGDCGGGSCVSLAANTTDCGECDNECVDSTDKCSGGNCTGQTCAGGTADCNGTGSDCETMLDTTANCGQCGLGCGPYPHSSAACTAGACAIGACDAGYLDCDGRVWNGCEVDARTAENCGGCKQVCAIPNATDSCSTGQCRLGECDEGRADCDDDLGNGCESSTALPQSCGTCGNDCTNRPNTQSGGCEDGACKLVCADGFRDCDGDTRNGCEAGLNDAQSCGGCDNDCTALDNVRSASCGDGVCSALQCEPGFSDCDGITSNGCERATDTATSCGGCDLPCSLPHAVVSCDSGSCRRVECMPGYEDCNGDPKDGCEASLNDAATCGSCTNACSGDLQCQNGQCRCSDDDQCGSSREACCEGVCVDVQSVCSLWPCPIPGTSRPVLNCGECGTDCRSVAAYFCCSI